MTLTILASVSLLALVSSARPLPKLDADDGWNALQLSDADAKAQAPSEIEYTIQAVVKAHSSTPEELDDKDIAVQLASVADVQTYLAHVDDTSVKAVVHLDPETLHSADELEMYETLHRLEMERGRRTPVPDDVLDRSLASLASSPRKLGTPSLADVPEAEAEENESWYDVFLGEHTVSTPVIVVVGTCIVSLLALGCIATVLYTAEVLKRSMFRSEAAWGVLGKLEKRGRRGQTEGAEHDRVTFKEKHLLADAPPVLRSESAGETAEATDVDEKYFDAELAEAEAEAEAADSARSTPYATPAMHTLDLPPAPAPAHHAAETADSTGTSELALPGALPPTVARPAWSRRAAAPSAHPEQQAHARARRPYNAHAELDAALAMQLRPGLGLGADAAWLVRFVMAVFGWCAVLVTSTKGSPAPAPRRRWAGAA